MKHPKEISKRSAKLRYILGKEVYLGFKKDKDIGHFYTVSRSLYGPLPFNKAVNFIATYLAYKNMGDEAFYTLKKEKKEKRKMEDIK